MKFKPLLALALLALSAFAVTMALPVRAYSPGNANYNCSANSPFGTGADGNATLDGTNTYSWASKSGSTYTLTKTVNLGDLTIDNGVYLKPTSSYTLNICGTYTPPTTSGGITNNGAVGFPGNNGVDGSNGAAGTTGGAGNGVTVYETVSCCFFSNGASSSGGNGASGAAIAQGTTSGPTVTSGAGGSPGSTGGTGNDGTAGYSGASGGTITINVWIIGGTGDMGPVQAVGGRGGYGGNGGNGG